MKERKTKILEGETNLKNNKMTNSIIDIKDAQNKLCQNAHNIAFQSPTPMYEDHPIHRENFLIMLEFVPLEHGKCKHYKA